MNLEAKPFGFPFEPYHIQKDFMEELYNVLEHGKIGIFESPTGTVRFSSVANKHFIQYFNIRVNHSV